MQSTASVAFGCRLARRHSEELYELTLRPPIVGVGLPTGRGATSLLKRNGLLKFSACLMREGILPFL